MRGLPNCPLSIKDLGVYLVAAFFCTPSPDSGIPFPVVWPTLSLFSPAFSAWEQKGSCALFLQGSPSQHAGWVLWGIRSLGSLTRLP